MEAKADGGKTEKGGAEIDTRPPIRSVRDAVSMFGEGVFLKQTLPKGGSNLKTITMELEETKQSLEKAREETELMATQMSSLKLELDNTKRELQQLKELRGSKMVTFDLEELKLMKDSPVSENDKEETEFQNKRCVTFAHPTLSQIISHERNPSPALLERSSSLKKEKKKKKKFALLPLFGRIPRKETKCDL